ncbi:MAG: hypothetical protein QF816_05130, partial [Candidatus Scalindua sp.]|nr:hypothetical protein [Candidatus Scalindua sp.]
ISVTAIPPSGLFISEFMMFKSLFAGEHYFVAIVALFLLTIILYVIGKCLMHLLYFKGEGIATLKPVKLNNLETLSQFVLLGLIFYLGANPPVFFTDLITGATAILK